MLIANRGEIAVRIIRAARELGIHSIQVYSEADADSLAVCLADEAVLIGPPPAAHSYLNSAALLAAAVTTAADAIHPGYGFLAENADFAAAVESAGRIFVGPAAATIRQMGDKVQARHLAAAAHLPTVPGSEGRVRNAAEALTLSAQWGFPLLLKAAGGGGGRGIRLVADAASLERHFLQAAAEARAAFGDGGLYMERVIPKARHIEVQIVGDGRRYVHLFERECSLQRRRQKLWEEAPAPGLSESVRQKMCAAALRLAAAVSYRGVGTVEFLYEPDSEAFYFIEMNTRIQVEHPVTEELTGIDLLRQSLRIAAGEGLQLQQSEIACRGHAIEIRLNAEDAAADFAPQPGRIDRLRIPAGPGVRFDSLLFVGAEVPPFYDSLLAKMVVWDESRPAALKRLKRALTEWDIGGVKTTAPLFRALLHTEALQQGCLDTTWLERWLSEHGATIAQFVR